MITIGYGQTGSAGALTWQDHAIDPVPNTSLSIDLTGPGEYLVCLGGAWDAAVTLTSLDGVSITPLHTLTGSADTEQIIFGKVTITSAAGAKTLAFTDPAGTNHRVVGCAWKNTGLNLSGGVGYNFNETEGPIDVTTYAGGAVAGLLLNQDADTLGWIGLDVDDLPVAVIELSFVVNIRHSNTATGGIVPISCDDGGNLARLHGVIFSIPPA